MLSSIFRPSSVTDCGPISERRPTFFAGHRIVVGHIVAVVSGGHRAGVERGAQLGIRIRIGETATRRRAGQLIIPRPSHVRAIDVDLAETGRNGRQTVQVDGLIDARRARRGDGTYDGRRRTFLPGRIGERDLIVVRARRYVSRAGIRSGRRGGRGRRRQSRQVDCRGTGGRRDRRVAEGLRLDDLRRGGHGFGRAKISLQIDVLRGLCNRGAAQRNRQGLQRCFLDVEIFVDAIAQ